MRVLSKFFPVLVFVSIAGCMSDTPFDRMKALARDWEETDNDSLFVTEYSELIDRPSCFSEGTYPPGTDSAFRNAGPGDVIGPFTIGTSYFLFKITGVQKLFDSAQVAHIFFAYSGAASAPPDLVRTKEQAKKTADSLCSLIRSGTVILEDVVDTVTEDPGSLYGNKGNYGWFTRESDFVDEFESAGFDNPVGSTVVIETAFGFHIVQVKAHSMEKDCKLAWFVCKSIDSWYLNHED